MKVEKTAIEGVYILHLFNAADQRGEFVKTFHKASLSAAGLNTQFDESFYSINKKGVIRGMHFQVPPEDHDKIVYCSNGTLNDVILDIRKDSPTYGEFVKIKLSAQNHLGVYIAKGLAHGFESLEDHTIMTYLTSTMHSAAHDSGILHTSFGCEWDTTNPIINERDTQWPALQDFKSPF